VQFRFQNNLVTKACCLVFDFSTVEKNSFEKSPALECSLRSDCATAQKVWTNPGVLQSAQVFRKLRKAAACRPQPRLPVGLNVQGPGRLVRTGAVDCRQFVSQPMPELFSARIIARWRTSLPVRIVRASSTRGKNVQISCSDVLISFSLPSTMSRVACHGPTRCQLRQAKLDRYFCRVPSPCRMSRCQVSFSRIPDELCFDGQALLLLRRGHNSAKVS